MVEGMMQWVKILSGWIEILAVALIVIAVIYGTLHYLISVAQRQDSPNVRYTRFRQRLARALMLSLELLVAADVVRTVALEPNYQNVSVLAMLVMIRIVLGWSLVVEIEGHWPWRPDPKNSQKPE
jgi:uncharacterized membrane protein